MTKEIKFRVWQSSRHKRTIMQDNPVYSDVGSIILTLAEMDPRNYIVEQYTGLKDKNGHEIFEGDVVVNVRNINGTLKEYGEPFVVSCDTYIYGKWLFRFVDTNNFGVEDFAKGTDVKVIGNIHNE